MLQLAAAKAASTALPTSIADEKNQLALVARLRKPVTELITEVCHKFCFQGMCGVHMSTHRSIVKMEKRIELENYANLHGYKIIAVTESWAVWMVLPCFVKTDVM